VLQETVLTVTAFCINIWIHKSLLLLQKIDKMKTSFLRYKVIPLFLLVVSYLLIYNPWTKFPYTFCVIILFIFLATLLQDKNIESLNFKRIGTREIKILISCYLIFELSADFIFQPLINAVCNEPADYSSFAHIQGNEQLYFEWLLKMWISAAIGEELLFRAFVFSQLNRIIGNKSLVIVIISAALFSLPHLYQGTAGLLTTFIFGFGFALIYMKFKNIWINIIVHGLIDTIFLTLSYFGLIDFYSLIW
jgi:uncharacterized protein